MAEQSVTLEPGESQEVVFEATPHEPKTYSVSVNGLTGSFKAVTPPLAIVLGDGFYPYEEGGWCRVLGVEGIPFTKVDGLVATLKTPIVMSVMRGITVNVEVSDLSKWSWSTGYPSLFATLWYYPQFDAPMPPPAFQGSGNIPGTHYESPPYSWWGPTGGKTSVVINTCFGRGYYYPGIYDGGIGILACSPGMIEYVGYPSEMFRIKNLIKVTGTGTV